MAVKNKYVAPEFEKTAFNCPHCGAYSSIVWNSVYRYYYDGFRSNKIDVAYLKLSSCSHCGGEHLWFNEKLIYPEMIIEMPEDDMPENIKEIYNEAANIVSKSPRGSCALLRLAVQELCIHLGEGGKNINEDIGNLVKKGLDVKIQKSLDVLRVIGNNAVHPGVIDLKDNDEIALKMFTLLNFVVREMITKPKEIDEIYSSIPDNLTDAIERRDSNT